MLTNEDIKALDWEKTGGLIPAVVQDACSGRVLMLGCMNPEALEKTLETKKVTFWSRTKGRLWTKGETSGNWLHLVDIGTDCDSDALLLLLDAKGICASSGSACTSGSLDPSHVLLAIGRPHEVAHGSLRLTLSEENTQEEVDYIIEETTKVVKYLRDLSPVWKELLSGERKFTF